MCSTVQLSMFFVVLTATRLYYHKQLCLSTTFSIFYFYFLFRIRLESSINLFVSVVFRDSYIRIAFIILFVNVYFSISSHIFYKIVLILIFIYLPSKKPTALTIATASQTSARFSVFPPVKTFSHSSNI